jgi:GAF domain-containing protein
MNEADEEAKRLATLRDYRLMDTAAEAHLDGIVRAAAEAAGTPMSTISLIDDRRQWFKARVGVAHQETPLDESICAQVIRGDGAVVLPDAAADARFRDNPRVGGEDGVRFYAGVPLVMRDGSKLGTLCVLDTVPHDGLDDDALETLQRLARRTMAAFEFARDLSEEGRLDPATAEDRVWLDRAGELLVQASAALDRVEAGAPAALLEQVIAMVDAMRAAPAAEDKT